MKQVLAAAAEGIARGLLVQLDKGVSLTPKGMLYAERIWSSFSDLDKLLLAGYLKEATADAK